MTFLQFKDKWQRVGCFSIYQIRAWNPDFDRTNLSRWVERGYLLKLRQEWYAFPELMKFPEAARYVAGVLCRPSYISLHAALAFYGIIPESVSKMTSVTTKRTAVYANAFGEYSYQTIKPSLFFGYRQMSFSAGGSYLLAEAEKALVDLLYLYPQYDSAQSMLDLRLDDWWVQEEMDVSKMREFALRSGVKKLQNRVDLLLKTYKND